MPTRPNTTNDARCLECGQPLRGEALEGFCPRCLSRLAFGAEFAADGAANVVTRSVGDYDFIEEIGRGGMGVVWKARQRSLDRIVALKFILAGSFASREFIERFRAEATAAGRLKHPNIVAVHEVGEHEGHHYFSMDFIDGRSLAQVVREEPPALRHTARTLRLIAEAIHHAHERGIVHRDLKPSNIIVDAAGDPHITDFGLARELNADDGLTLTGQAFGSPSFAAPEQIGGARPPSDATPPPVHTASEVETQAPGPAAARREARVPLTGSVDIYGMGAILYYSLTGRPPFAGTTLANLLSAVQEKEPVAPRLLNADVPADLETICLKCLEKEPAKRYGTAQELAEDLARFLRDEPILARPVTRGERAWRWCRRKPALAGSLAAAAVLLLAVLIGSPIAAWRIDQLRKAEQVQLTRAEDGELKARQTAYASDMNLAHQAVQDDDFRLALELLERHRPPHTQLSTIHYPLSTDLRGWEWRYLWRQCQGEERFILGENKGGYTAVGILADGKTVFSAGRDKCVRLWDLESRREIGTPLRHAEEVIGAAASRDGWLATITGKGAEGQPVLLWDLATQKADTLMRDLWLCPGITFSPDGKWLAFATVLGNGLVLWDVNEHRPVPNQPESHASTESRGIAFSPDSRTLAYNENNYGVILLWDIESRKEKGRLTGHEGAVTALAFAPPDGRMLASASDDRTARIWNVAERRVVHPFSNRDGAFTSVAFSPDGGTLAMSGDGAAGRVIRLVDVATGNPKAKLRGHRGDISSLAFTPDGKTLLSASDYGGSIRVWDVVPGAKEKPFHEFAPNSIHTEWGTFGPALCPSPDGCHLLTVYNDQTFSVWDTLNLTEGEPHPLPFRTESLFIAAVAPGGRQAAFGSRSGEVMLWDAETGKCRPFPHPGKDRINRLVFWHDGRSLAAAVKARPLERMAAGGESSTVRVWDVGTGKETHSFFTDGAFSLSLRFSADGKMLMAGFTNGSVKLWPLDGQGEATTIDGGQFETVAPALAMLSDGQTLISAGDVVQFWDVRTRQENAPQLHPGTGWFSGAMAVSTDGRRLATGNKDGRITIWDLAAHLEVATLEEHKSAVTQLAFTPDGDHLVSASKDQLRVWRAASWAESDAEKKEAGK